MENQTPNQSPASPRSPINQHPVVQRIVRPIERVRVKGKANPRIYLAGLAVIIAGIGSGWLLAGRPGGAVLGNGSGAPDAGKIDGGVGIADESTFRDSAEGILKTGGIDGEGTHHLVREGGESKYVYLTSTVIDLEGFAGKQVEVWGETITARKAGWLMDVGKVKVLE
jgi:hypothetical protein